MKYIIIFLSVFFFITQPIIYSQNELGKTEDLGRISIKTVVPGPEDGLPNSAANYLENKLNQLTASQGLSGGGYYERFILTPVISSTTKEVTSTAPVMYAYNIDLTIYIADVFTKNIFAQETISLKGVGKTEDKAFIQGFKTVNPNNPILIEFVNNGKRKIIEYYNTECDFILSRADMLASQRKYEEAIFLLVTIPEVCKDCFDKSMLKVGEIYQDYIDYLCDVNYASAKSVWIANPNSEGANDVIQYLSQILPDAKCYNNAQALSNEIANKVLADEQRDWNFMMKKWDDRVSLESQRIEAYRDVGVAYGENQPDVEYILRGWLW